MTAQQDVNPLTIMAKPGGVILFWDRTAEHEYELDIKQTLMVIAVLGTAVRIVAYDAGLKPKQFLRMSAKAQKRADQQGDRRDGPARPGARVIAVVQAVAFLLLCALIGWSLGGLVLMWRDERRARLLDQHGDEAIRQSRSPEVWE